MSDQKKLVRDTFNEDAPSWSDWAYDPDSTYEIYPTGKPRLRQIRRELERFYPRRKLRLLDAGCGTGDVALALAADGHTVQGIDFAPAMIAECVRRYDAAFPARADALARFRIGDVETLDFPDGSFDAVYAVGLLEYLERDRPFFDEVRRVLAPGGLFIVECKNRLFNVMSGNRFTTQEAEDGTLGQLIAELADIDRYSPRPASDIPALLASSTPALAGIGVADEPAERKIGKTFPPGIVRRLFTPAEIDLVLYGSELPMQHVVYYHTHWLPPVFENGFPRFYNQMSLLLDCLGETPAGAYLGSCFLAVARKTA